MTLLPLLLLAALPAADARLDAAFEKVDPAVVTIRVAIRRIEGNEQRMRIDTGIGTGSGVVLHSGGFVATAAHVVEEAEAIELEYKDGTKSGAHVVTLSRTEDLALLKADYVPKDLVVPALADSDKVKVGQIVFAVGTPEGYPHTMSTGIVSSIRNEAPKGLVPGHVIQTDAALNPGNSGGPLFTERGEVLGIASYIYSKSGGSEGLGFAIPSNTVRRRLFERPLPYLGVSLRIIPKPIMELFNWPYPAGILVEKVRPGSAAANAGLRAGMVDAIVGDSQVKLGGDLIVKVGTYDASKLDEIGTYLTTLKAGDPVNYTVLRNGQEVSVSVPVPERELIPALGPKKK
jgi:S1-C subfamily serine protease